jgi:FtsH-binding integral membrane protein
MNTENVIVAQANEYDRATFFRKTYSHVSVAILAFIGLESLLLKIVPTETILWMMSGRMIWLFIIGLMWLGSMLSNRLVFHPSRDNQYLGLGIYVILEAIVFLPLIFMACAMSGVDLVAQAGMITLALFAGLTAVVFVSKKDFSFLRAAITIGGFLSLGAILVGMLFGFDLGLWFSVAMVVLASGSILYQTSKIKNEFTTDQYVGASLQLFSSIMLLFWYVLRILMSRRN